MMGARNLSESNKWLTLIKAFDVVPLVVVDVVGRMVVVVTVVAALVGVVRVGVVLAVLAASVCDAGVKWTPPNRPHVFLHCCSMKLANAEFWRQYPSVA